jgi:two-component system, sensor histidine kinase RegB
MTLATLLKPWRTNSVRRQSDHSAHWINLRWLSKLRWGAILGQLATIFFVHLFLAMKLPLGPLLFIVGAEAASNLAVHVWLRRNQDVGEGGLFAATAADVFALTGLLYFTGGPFNPFSFLYLVHIALAAVVLASSWTWALFGLSLLCFGALFLDHIGLVDPHTLHAHSEKNSEFMMMHVQGMWLAFAVAGAFICFFVTRIRQALAAREADLAEAKSRAALAERLASLVTLAAGAAHELSSPLGTIAVATRELELEFRQRIPGEGEMLDDLRLIRDEVERCRTILEQMAADAGESSGARYARVSVREIVDRAGVGLSGPGDVRVEGEGAVLDRLLEVPERSLEQALRAVLRNAQEASPRGEPIVVAVVARDTAIEIQVRDKGAGMAEKTLARLGEPFFTTKETGKGMGLGVFLAKAVLTRLGGALVFDSKPGTGTIALLTVPVEGDNLPPSARPNRNALSASHS